MTLYEKTVNVFAKLDDNPPNGCWAISLWTTNVNLLVELEEKPDVIRNHLWETINIQYVTLAQLSV